MLLYAQRTHIHTSIENNKSQSSVVEIDSTVRLRLTFWQRLTCIRRFYPLHLQHTLSFFWSWCQVRHRQMQYGWCACPLACNPRIVVLTSWNTYFVCGLLLHSCIVRIMVCSGANIFLWQVTHMFKTCKKRTKRPLKWKHVTISQHMNKCLMFWSASRHAF